MQDCIQNLAGCGMYVGAGALAIIYHTNPASVYKQYYIQYDQVIEPVLTRLLNLVRSMNIL
jgi:hypothetical protein